VEKEILDLIEEYKPYRNDYRKDTISFLYGETVNSIVKFWVSAWKASGHKITEFNKIKPEIDHKEYAVEKNDIKRYRSGLKAPHSNEVDRKNNYIWLHQNR
jgi:hypothetical protein